VQSGRGDCVAVLARLRRLAAAGDGRDTLGELVDGSARAGVNGVINDDATFHNT